MPTEQTPGSGWSGKLYRLLLGGSALTLLVLLIALALWGLANIGTHPITDIKVDGELRHVTRPQLRALIAPQAQRGFFGMDVATLRDQLQAVPWVASAQVRRIWPGRLELRIRERVPLTRWGSQALLSRNGERFRPPPESMPDNLPWLDGPKHSEQRVLEQYRQFVQLLKVSGLGVASLVLDQRGAWRLTLDNGLELLLGREQMSKRLWRLVQVYATVIKPKVSGIGQVDLRYSNGFALSWRKQATAGK